MRGQPLSSDDRTKYAYKIRAADLAFDQHEARELLREHDVELADNDLGLLLGRTEGWAAGLRLAALSLTRQKDVSSYIATFAGDDQPVADYLVSEVLSQLPPDVRAFLLVTAVPEKLTVELAGELTGRVDAGAVLEQLARDNVLAYRQDSSPFWGDQTFPGLWIFSADQVFQGIRVTDVDIVDPTYSGIMFQTKYTGGQPEHPVTDTVFTNVSISGAQLSGDEFEAKSGFGIWVNEMPEQGQGPAVGSAVFNNLTFSNNHQNIKNTTSTFELIIND